jgi:diguanylate cyclase (GGDEF)-like protein
LLLVVPGGYVTYFHGPRVLAVHGLWAVGSAVTLTTVMVVDGHGDLASAAAIVLIMVAANVVVLPGLHLGYWLLRTDALSDSLTMLLNRRGLDYYLDRYLTRTESAVAVMVLDIDRFKAVNDTYGHQVGDQILTRTADRLRAATGRGAVVARSGGEEFVVAIELGADQALAAAERLRDAVATMSCPGAPITVSVGVAISDGPRASGYSADLLCKADAAMYRAKHAGGNTIAIAAPVGPS